MNRSSSRLSLREQFEVDEQTIIAEVERITGLASRWTGKIIVGSETNILGGPLYRGIKEWNCDIKIHESLLGNVASYSTGVHEAFHSVSVGLTVADYATFQGFEEGVVESCTRLFREEILRPLNLTEELETRSAYNLEIALLEQLRSQCRTEERAFYLDLLHTPLCDRESIVIQWIDTANPSRGRAELLREIAPLVKGLKP